MCPPRSHPIRPERDSDGESKSGWFEEKVNGETVSRMWEDGHPVYSHGGSEAHNTKRYLLGDGVIRAPDFMMGSLV